MQAMEAQATLKISSSSDAHGLVKEENSSPESIHHQKSGDEDAKLDEVGLTKTEMGKVREENERLKKMLKQIEKDYISLQMRFFNILDQQEACKISKDSAASHRDNEEPGFVSLCLGRSTNEPKRDDTTSTTSSSKAKEEQLLNENLSLGLDLKFQVSKPNPMEMEGMNSSQENSFEEQKDVAGETWPPNNGSKVMKNGDDEVSQQNNAKRARVSVRARCDTPTMNDGCQWRKYGQKTAKGNPCPRAYYRCTGAPACPVRKQVQRSAEDMSILITTYEGAHNHQLSVSATAMASTTSAAASMLISGSSTSQSDLSTLVTHGLNFNHYDNSRQRQFYIPNSSTAAYQTVTLDLTTSLSSSSNLFNRLTSNSRTLPSTSVNFASSESNNILPTLWGNSYLNHGSTIPYNNTLNRGRQSLEHLFQPYMEQKQAPPHQFLTETLTKAITSDPSFRSVIATAISSMVGGSGTKVNQGGGESVSQNLKWSEPIPANNSPNLLTHKVKGCASSYLDRTSSSNSQTGSLMFLQPPSSCTISKNPSTDKENQNN